MGMGWLLKAGLQAFSRTNLPVSGVVVKPYVVILTLVVGILFTVVAALIPALRASRVPPIAAMRDAAVPDKPLRVLTRDGASILFPGDGARALRLPHVRQG